MQNNNSLKVTLIMVMSANGMVAQERDQDSSAWNSPDDRHQLLEKIRSIGAVVMGANTYRIIEDKLYKGADFFVLTRDSSQFRPQPQVTFIKGDVPEICQQLQQRNISHIALLGGSETNSAFLNANRVDEIFLTLEPLLLPGNLNLGNQLSDPSQLTLLNVEPLQNGQTLLLHYRVENRPK
jgi:dihydrofolate reductase